MEENTRPKPGVLTLTIKDKTVLYTSYMSFLKEGGLFIPTSRSFPMGEELSMLLNLMEEAEKLPVTGTVVWVTPKGAQGNRAPGIGVQFKGDEGKLVRNKIETYLAGTLKADKPTHSM
jgi:type IV pilus assembly protein PilZ